MTSREALARARETILTEKLRRHGQDFDTCPHCEGVGAYWDDQTGQPDEPNGGRMVTCETCKGEKVVDTSPCIACGGRVYDHDEGCPMGRGGAMTTATLAGPFSPRDFTDGSRHGSDPGDNPYFSQDHRMDSPANKAAMANQLVALLSDPARPIELFTEELYSVMNLKLYGHIAEFSRHGFYGGNFSTPQRAARWVARARKGGPYGFSDLGRPRLWGDVERAIAKWLDDSGVGDRIVEEARADTEQQEKAQLAELVAKYPETASELTDEVNR